MNLPEFNESCHPPHGFLTASMANIVHVPSTLQGLPCASVHTACTCCSFPLADLSPSHISGLIAFVLQNSASLFSPTVNSSLAFLKLQSKSDTIHTNLTAVQIRSTSCIRLSKFYAWFTWTDFPY